MQNENKHTGVAVYDMPTLVLPTPEGVQKGTHKVVGVGAATLANERHDYCGDAATALSFANGRGAFVIAADGIGSGGHFSVDAATEVVNNCSALFADTSRLPGLQEGRRLLRDALMQSARNIRKLKETLLQNPDIVDEDERKKISKMGTTAAMGLTCVDGNGNTVLLTANRGDSEILVVDVDALPYRVSEERHFSSVRMVTRREAKENDLTRFVSPESVALMGGFMGEGFSVDRLPAHTLLIATTDGLRKHMPVDMQEAIIKRYFAFASNSKNSMGTFATLICENIKARWKRDPLAPRDDVSVAAVELVGAQERRR